MCMCTFCICITYNLHVKLCKFLCEIFTKITSSINGFRFVSHARYIHFTCNDRHFACANHACVLHAKYYDFTCEISLSESCASHAKHMQFACNLHVKSF